MATNTVNNDGHLLSLACDDPATPASGDPVRLGNLVGLAETAERADGTTSVRIGGVHKFSVKGVNGSGNSAVAVGDSIFYVDADTPKLSKKATGHLAGIALEAITSGSTATIKVRLNESVNA